MGGNDLDLVGGNDLDGKGYDITCTATSPAVSACTAIESSGSATKVTSDQADGTAAISGPFVTGVDSTKTPLRSSTTSP